MIMPLSVFSTAILVSNFPNIWWFDQLCAIGLSTKILLASYPSLNECRNIMMEASPLTINGDEIVQDIWSACKEDVVDVHDLHLWSLSQNKIVMSVHIKSYTPLKTLKIVTDLCQTKYHLFHTTIQVEGIDKKDVNIHHFCCENDIHS